MPHLSEVQTALKQGDKARANQLLKSILQQHPTADAWVMAARMTSNPETAKMHLQRALSFDPKHVKARDMLRDLGGKPMTGSAAFTNGLFPALRAELEKFGANKPVLRDLSPQQRMITAVSLYVVVIAALLAMVGILITPTLPPESPTITSVKVFESDALISQWNTAGLNISNLENVIQTPDVLSKEQINFTVTDDRGPHRINLFLYNDVSGIVNDGQRLTALTEDAQYTMDILQTAVIVYPVDVNEATITLLESVLNPAPIPAPL